MGTLINAHANRGHRFNHSLYIYCSLKFKFQIQPHTPSLSSPLLELFVKHLTSPLPREKVTNINGFFYSNKMCLNIIIILVPCKALLIITEL